jgi:hypothetical protein
MIGASIAFERIKEVVSDAVTRGVLIGVDHQTIQSGIRYTPFEGNVKGVSVGIASRVFFDIDTADP